MKCTGFVVAVELKSQAHTRLKKWELKQKREYPTSSVKTRVSRRDTHLGRCSWMFTVKFIQNYYFGFCKNCSSTVVINIVYACVDNKIFNIKAFHTHRIQTINSVYAKVWHFCAIEASKSPCITIIFSLSSFICKLSYHCIGSYRLHGLQVESNLECTSAVINWASSTSSQWSQEEWNCALGCLW